MPDLAELPPMPPGAPETRRAHASRPSPLLGATAGANTGRVRAYLVLLLTAAFCLIVAYANVMYFTGHELAHDTAAGGFTALVAAFTGGVGYYMGRRTAEGA